jgi:OOP family OmpA-OmpF porin
MRARIALASFAASFAAVLSAPAAEATDCSGFLSPCINDDTLWPHAGPSRFVAIGSTETVAAGQVGFGIVTSYLNRPVILATRLGGAETDQYAINDQVNGTFLWAYGVTSRLELDLAVPLTFGQGGTGLAPITGGYGLKDTAVRDMRFGFAYELVPHERVSDEAQRQAWGLVARLEVSAPTGDSDQFAGEQSGVFVPSVAGDWRSGRWFAGAELGARLRPTAEVLGARIGTQLVTMVGAGYDVLRRRELLTVALEAWALPTFAEQHEITNPNGVYVSTPDGQHILPAEWQLSARTAPLRGGDLSVQASGGGGIPLTSDVGITTPRFRFTLGLRWAPLARDTDRDGVPDFQDRCPTEPAHTRSGCPAGPAAPSAPAVDLHLSTAHDVCTSEPELVDGFKDNDGCPDEDQDKDGIPDRFDKCPLVPEDYVGPADGCPEKH